MYHLTPPKDVAHESQWGCGGGVQSSDVSFLKESALLGEHWEPTLIHTEYIHARVFWKI